MKPVVDDAVDGERIDRMAADLDEMRTALSLLVRDAIEYMASTCALLEGQDLEHAERALDRLRERTKAAGKIVRRR